MKKSLIFAALIVSSELVLATPKTSAKPKKNLEHLQSEMIAAAKKAVAYSLIDPDSAKFRDVFVAPNGVAVCGQINAKNRYGGYGGFQRFIYTPSKHGIYGDGSSFVEARWEERCIIGTLDDLDDRAPVLQ